VRPYCEIPTACRATTERMCKRCTIVHRNKSPEIRALHRELKLKNPTLTPAVMASALTPEARAKAQETRRERAMAWCPAEYREWYKHITRLNIHQRLTAAEARKVIEDEIAAKAGKREVVHFEGASERIARSHDRMKMGGRDHGWQLKAGCLMNCGSLTLANNNE
jgi:hypothetical protein